MMSKERRDGSSINKAFPVVISEGSLYLTHIQEKLSSV